MLESLVEAGQEIARQNPQEALGAGVITVSLFAMAFSRPVRAAILRKSNGRCVREDGTCMGGMEATHDDHDRNNPKYDTVENSKGGMCTKHHLDDHEEREGRNGLSRYNNNRAKASLRARLRKFIEENSQ